MSLVLVEVELSKSYLTFVILAVEGIMTSTDGRTGKLIFKSNIMSLSTGISRPNAKVVVYARQYFPSFKLLFSRITISYSKDLSKAKIPPN